MPIDYAAFGYAAAVAGGGILGYVKTKSIPSLAAGILFGTILSYGAYQTSQNPRDCGVLLGGGLVLGGMMGYRYYNTGKIMPAGLIAILSAIMIVRTAIRGITMPMKTE
ncbi:hypothetical protein PV327_003807 [Microctonus hyperodae]|uniref:Transmembrane protein 14C n=1 Tax=Microctonus hyperodae TaxID=165561 RepID=A0AA39G4Q9_MICHY|nr:hypothetical protein PV327_003807 [Microctonus hyperodae]